MSEEGLKSKIEAAFADRSLLSGEDIKQAVREVIAALDAGRLRVATQDAPGKWTTHAWVKQAVLLYFAVCPMEKMTLEPFEFFDKIPLKHDLDKAGVRVVPPGTV